MPALKKLAAPIAAGLLALGLGLGLASAASGSTVHAAAPTVLYHG